METQRADGTLGFHPYFHIRHDQHGRVVSCTRRSHFTPKEILWYSFLLEDEWTPGSLKTSNEPPGNGTQDLPSCGVVPQPTTPPLHIGLLFTLLTTSPNSKSRSRCTAMLTLFVASLSQSVQANAGTVFFCIVPVSLITSHHTT